MSEEMFHVPLAYETLMPFVACASEGGTYDDSAFAAGIRFQQWQSGIGSSTASPMFSVATSHPRWSRSWSCSPCSSATSWSTSHGRSLPMNGRCCRFARPDYTTLEGEQ